MHLLSISTLHHHVRQILLRKPRSSSQKYLCFHKTTLQTSLICWMTCRSGSQMNSLKGFLQCSLVVGSNIGSLVNSLSTIVTWNHGRHEVPLLWVLPLRAHIFTALEDVRWHGRRWPTNCHCKKQSFEWRCSQCVCLEVQPVHHPLHTCDTIAFNR